MAPQQQDSSTNHLGIKKTAFVIITVLGCIAILWPKIISPIFSQQPQPTDSYRGPGCCVPEVNRQSLSNLTIKDADLRYFKKSGNDFRQERAAPFADVGIHPAMKERGRAFHPTKSVPIVKQTPTKTFKYNVEGRPGPIPGLKAAKDASAQYNKRREGGGATSFLLPAYTIGIVFFFVYTLIKLLAKKKEETLEKNQEKTEFKKRVFHAESENSNKKLTNKNIGWDEHKTNFLSKIVQPIVDNKISDDNLKSLDAPKSYSLENSDSFDTNTILEISELKKRLKQTEKKMCRIIEDMSVNENQAALKEDSKEKETSETSLLDSHNSNNNVSTNNTSESISADCDKVEDTIEADNNKISSDATDIDNLQLKVLGLELTTSCEDNIQWSHQDHSSESKPALQSIFLEGSIGHESNILVKEAETKTDEMLKDDSYDPMVVLSSKMTLSLINMDSESAN